MSDEQLAEAVRAQFTPKFMAGKQEIISYWKEEYGESGWRPHAAMAISGTTDKKSRAYKSAMRNFQGGREGAVARTAKDKGKWAAIGRRLPPTMIPPRAVKITAAGSIIVSGGGRKDAKGKTRGNGWAKMRKGEATLRGTDVLNPTWDMFFTSYFAGSYFESHPVSQHANPEVNHPVTDYDIVSLRVEAL